VPLLRKAVAGIHRSITSNPTEDNIEAETQKLVRAVMRELGMPAKRVNALYDADRKAGKKAKEKRYDDCVARDKDPSSGHEGARPADRGASSR
jgi:hypothetical protein